MFTTSFIAVEKLSKGEIKIRVLVRNRQAANKPKKKMEQEMFILNNVERKK